MTAGIYNTTIDQGSTWSLVITYKDPSGTPINLTGFTAEMQLRETFDSADAVLTLSTSNGGITIDGVAGELTLSASSDQTDDLAPGFYVYDLELIESGSRSRLIQGQITVAQQVTR